MEELSENTVALGGDELSALYRATVSSSIVAVISVNIAMSSSTSTNAAIESHIPAEISMSSGCKDEYVSWHLCKRKKSILLIGLTKHTAHCSLESS